MCFIAIPALKSHSSRSNDSTRAAFPSPGNPLAQEIMSLYQEPDGTRRLLNYLLDNLAGAIKRSESPCPLSGNCILPVVFFISSKDSLISIYKWRHCELNSLGPLMLLWHLCSCHHLLNLPPPSLFSTNRAAPSTVMDLSPRTGPSTGLR